MLYRKIDQYFQKKKKTILRHRQRKRLENHVRRLSTTFQKSVTVSVILFFETLIFIRIPRAFFNIHKRGDFSDPVFKM